MWYVLLLYIAHLALYIYIYIYIYIMINIFKKLVYVDMGILQMNYSIYVIMRSMLMYTGAISVLTHPRLTHIQLSVDLAYSPLMIIRPSWYKNFFTIAVESLASKNIKRKHILHATVFHLPCILCTWISSGGNCTQQSTFGIRHAKRISTVYIDATTLAV